MIRFAALGLLMFACGMAGALGQRNLSLRVRELEAALRMISSLRTQMQFSRAPMLPLVEQLCAQGQAPSFLPQCLAKMRAGLPFPSAWRQAAGAKAFDGLRDEDRRILLSLGDLLGTTDAAGQREGLLLHEELTRELLDRAQQRRNSQGKARLLLGILAGLTLMILLV
ncbi:MAG: stage III sporulation protein AB [Oscillospiraceae bacterium]|jgi:stage III sporulation protein AB|nr:stage III sporulation protein AB [Oscillospiraceae bacterium]